MPEYSFVDEDGNHELFCYSMKEVPPTGSKVTLGGKTWTRVIDIPQLSADIASKTHGYPYVSKALPRNMKGADTNKLGQPVIRSRWHEREMQARHDLGRD